MFENLGKDNLNYIPNHYKKIQRNMLKRFKTK